MEKGGSFNKIFSHKQRPRHAGAFVSALGNNIARRLIDTIPFFTGKAQLGALAGVFQSLGIHRADHHLHIRRMTGNPGDGHRSVGDPVGGGNLIDYLV